MNVGKQRWIIKRLNNADSIYREVDKIIADARHKYIPYRLKKLFQDLWVNNDAIINLIRGKRIKGKTYKIQNARRDTKVS